MFYDPYLFICYYVILPPPIVVFIPRFVYLLFALSRASLWKQSLNISPCSDPMNSFAICGTYWLELKDMKKLSANDEAFQLSSMEIRNIIRIILSRNTPAPETYTQWDEHAISFYLKMCTCYGVDYQHLEAASPDEMELKKHTESIFMTQPSIKEMSYEELVKQEKHMESTLMTQPSTKEMSYEKLIEQHMESTLMTQPSTKEMSYEELIEQAENKVITGVRVFLKAPFETGCYSSEPPDRIPYHLYLLVKEAVDYMKNPNDLIDLERVERKIQFFSKYFHSHLLTGWNYNRDNASSVIAGYNATRKPRYVMASYTPIGDWV